MTHDEAVEASERLSREHPDRATHFWIPREAAGGGWEIAKATLPPALAREKFTETIETRPKPPQADDPRSALTRNVPWPGGA